jgi:hypothetical protein
VMMLVQKSSRRPPRPRSHPGQPELLPGLPVPGPQFSSGFTLGGQNESFLFR